MSDGQAGRPRKLEDEQVLQIRANEEKKTNEEWAEYFDVSVVTIIAAKKGHRGYGQVA